MRLCLFCVQKSMPSSSTTLTDESRDGVASNNSPHGWSERLAGGKRIKWLLGKWRTPRLRARVGGLRQHEIELAALGESVERKFVAIGNSLQSQATLSTRLAEQGVRLLALASKGSGQETTAVGGAVELVQRMLQFTDETQQQTMALVEKMERYHEQIGRLLYEEQRVERIVAPLRVIQTLFRIEAAVLPVDVQTAFFALSGEIPKFEKKVRDAFTQHSDVLTVTRGRIKLTATSLRERASQQAAATAATRARVGETLANLDRELAQSRVRDSLLETIVREIDHEAGAVVVSLQYQDITRQKMEHVRTGLEEILARSQSSGLFGGATDLSYLHQACRLEALQSKAIHEELDGVVATLISGVRGMLDRLARIDRECWPRASFGQTTKAVEERVQILREAMEEAGALLPTVAAGADETIALLESFGNVAASVATTAGEMAEDMRMIALNAQVQAAQAGDAGAGLLILAERTYFISEEIKLVTRSIGSEFTEAARQLQVSMGEGAQLQGRIQATYGPLVAARARVDQGLDAYRGGTVEALHQLGELLERIEQEAANILPELENDQALGRPLIRLYDELAAIANTVESFASSSHGSLAQPEVLGAAQRRYTMDSERAVHASALASAGVAAAGVELFAEDAPSSAPSSPDSNVELF